MGHLILLLIIYVAFISLGLPDSVTGVAWPSMRVTFRQPLESLGLITFIVTVGSAVSSFFSGFILKRINTGPLVLLSGLATGFALLGFSWASGFWWILVLALPLGLGAGSVDAALNHFVAEHYSSRHMNWLHGFWGLGATLGPVILGLAIAGSGGWRVGYRQIAFLQLALAVMFFLSLPLWRREQSRKETEEKNSATHSLKPVHPGIPWLAAFLFFIYAAIELGIGLWTVSILVEGRAMNPLTAGLWLSAFYGSIMIGRFAIGFASARLGNRMLVRSGLLVALAGACLFAFPELPEELSLAGLILLGLGCAPIYPSLMHETPRRFPPDIARIVVGRQVAFAYIGSAIMPAAFGVVAASIGLTAVIPGVAGMILLLLLTSEFLNRKT